MRYLNLKITLVVFAFSVLALGQTLYGQQAQPSITRHPGEHLHYRVNLPDGDLDKITGVSVQLRSDFDTLNWPLLIV